jgi:hypothetical protein
VNDVDVGLEQALDLALAGIDADGDGAEDARDRDAITRLAEVDQLVVNTQRDRVRRLTIRDSVCARLSDGEYKHGSGAPGVSCRRMT